MDKNKFIKYKEDYIKINPNQKYCCSESFKAYIYDKDKNFIKTVSLEDFLNSKESEIPIGSIVRFRFK